MIARFPANAPGNFGADGGMHAFWRRAAEGAVDRREKLPQKRRWRFPRRTRRTRRTRITRITRIMRIMRITRITRRRGATFCSRFQMNCGFRGLTRVQNPNPRNPRCPRSIPSPPSGFKYARWRSGECAVASRRSQMKIEFPLFLALAAALAWSGGRSESACGPGGCLLLPPDFAKAAEVIREREAAGRHAPPVAPAKPQAVPVS